MSASPTPTGAPDDDARAVPPVTGPAPTGGTAARRARQAAAQGGAGASNRRPSSTRRAPADRADGTGSRVLRRELDPDRLATLEEERDFLLRSLADLEREHDAGDVDEHDYVELKDDYTVRAAATLRALESRQATMDAVRAPRSRARVLSGIAIVALIAIGLGVFVAVSSGRRGVDDSLSGDTRQTNRDLLLEGQSLMGTDMNGALDRFEQVLRTSPDNVEALTWKGWLLYITAPAAKEERDRQLLVASALKSLTQAIDVDPEAQEARIFRASVYKNEGQFEAAAKDLAAVREDAVPPFMQERVAQLRAEVAAGPAGSAPATSP